MSTIRVEIKDSRIVEALRAAPAIMERRMGQAVMRGAEEIAREAKLQAPKAFSTLTQSIRAQRDSTLSARVAPGVEYAAYVEQGTRSGGFPPEQSMLDWIKAKGITPHDPDMDLEDLAFVLSRSIAAKGTAAQPFMAPAAERKESRVRDLIRQSVNAGIREVFGD